MSGQSLRDQIMDALGQLEDEQLQKVLDILRALRSRQDVLLLDETDMDWAVWWRCAP
jgi:ABC-type branched-subunit amino acid transport system ATPase component